MFVRVYVTETIRCFDTPRFRDEVTEPSTGGLPFSKFWPGFHFRCQTQACGHEERAHILREFLAEHTLSVQPLVFRFLRLDRELVTGFIPADGTGVGIIDS